ncbi:MAG TPA: diadenylate cyclase [Longimicrobiales bacterium]
MIPKNRAILDGAVLVARETGAHAILLAAALPEETDYLREMVGPEGHIIAAATNGESGLITEADVLSLPEVRMRRRGRAKIALLEGLAAGLLRPDERVIIISGNAIDGECELDTVAVVDLSNEEDYLDGQADAPLNILSQVSDPAVFDAVLTLCVELGHVGREGRPVGLLVTLGDHETVLERSHPLVLNPFEGHPESERQVLNPRAKRAIREFSGMDGAFVIRGDGVIIAAGRYLQELAPPGDVPPGLGARHRAAAGITAATRCVAFVVSESTGDTRVFGGGRIIMTIEATD